MENALIKSYYDDVRISEISQHIKNHNKTLVSGLHGSSKPVVVAACMKQATGQHFVVCSDRESAAYFYNDLENLLGEQELDYNKKQVLFYPTSYKRPYEPEKPDNTYILSRTEVLQRLSSSERKTIIVSYPEALSEKVFTRRLLAKNTYKVKVGDRISLDFLSDVLFEYGFENVDFVVEPGQFAIRGGLIDVFSFANEVPYRIEFFGDEVDSIRSFKIGTQLSIESLNNIVLLPNMQERSFIEERESILQYLPKDVSLWFEEMKNFDAMVDSEYEKAVAAFEKYHADDKDMRPDKLFSKAHELRSHIQQHATIEFGQNSYLDAANSIAFNTKSQPPFNKNFELLLNDLREHIDDGYNILFFSESSKQLDRIQSILNDLQHHDALHNDFTPVLHALHAGFIDSDNKICCYTDHQIFERYHRYRLRDNFSDKQAITLKELYDLKPGDYVTHIDHGIGRFDGLETINCNGKSQETLRLFYQNGDILYVSIHSLHRIAKYSSKDGIEPTLSKLGSNTWNRLKSRTKSKVKDIARELIKLYAERKKSKGFAFAPDTYLQHELEASFLFEDTPDQLKATVDIKRDMESDNPMDRLICGDVGFGKTEVAIRAAFKAATDSKQVAVLVPTTVLALQHYHTFQNRLRGFPVNIEYLNRFKTAKQQSEILKKLKEGSIDIIIGTHKLTGKDVKFKDLGLLIIDEEQKFGVSTKEKLKELKANIDTLTLSATPIPRTLQFSMMGARDLSIMSTPPANRQPVQTELHGFDGDFIREAIQYELARNGQVFFIHNRVQNIMDVYDFILRHVPGTRIAVAHGQMDGKKLEEVMLAFIEGEYDVLLCTTIVESGLDVTNANTIIINDAHHFGLSDLHQLRGRVGRSNKKAFCYLLTPPFAALTQEAQKRLRAIEEFSDLGSGFNIAMRDLDIRGAGNLLGGEQSGFINDIGFETYHKILDEAIKELKENEFSDIFDSEKQDKEYVSDCVIETDMEIRFPIEYIDSTTERMRLYTELDHIETEERLSEFTEHLIDRFGTIPKQVNDLLNTVRLRWTAKKLGFEKIMLKKHNMNIVFVSNPDSRYYDSSLFKNILQYVGSHPKRCQMSDNGEKLILQIKEISTVTQALTLLYEMQDCISETKE